jgi:hypothetical protein
MVGYKAVQKALHGVPYFEDIDQLDKCINVLDYCALKDAMAGRFRDLLESQVSELRKYKETKGGPTGDAAVEDAQLFNILFTFSSGSSELHMTARNLLKLMHHPFDGLKDVSTQATLSNRAETTIGAHFEWEWELKGSDCVTKVAEPDTMCGANAVNKTSVQRLMLQPEGGAWNLWTPPVGI